MQDVVRRSTASCRFFIFIFILFLSTGCSLAKWFHKSFVVMVRPLFDLGYLSPEEDDVFEPGHPISEEYEV